MAFESWQAFWDMQGHGVYVWSVVVITVISVAVSLIAPAMQYRKCLAKERRLAKDRHLAKSVTD